MNRRSILGISGTIRSRSKLAWLATGILTLAFVSPALAKPSFSCSSRLNSTERAICDSSNLSALDRKMASEYRFQLKQQTTRSERSRLQSAQRQWLNKRNRCGDDSSCIAGEYNQWLEQLREWGI